MKLHILLFAALSLPSLAFSKTSDTVKIFFRFNENVLTKESEAYLDSLAYSDYYRPGQKLTILGYADYVGTADFNQGLSFKRANSVKDYLANYLSLRAEVVVCAGKGKIEGAPVTGQKGNSADRYVAIVRAVPHAASKPIAAATEKPQPPPPPKYRHRHEEYPGARADDELGAYMVAHNRLHEDDTDARQHESKEGRVWTGIIALNTTGQEKQNILRKLPKLTGFSYSYNIMNLAMLYGLEAKPDSAIACLNIALDSCTSGAACKAIWDPNILGFFQFEKFRGTKEWALFQARIIKEFNKNKRIKNPSLALQLIIAGGADQSVRFPTPSDREEETEHAWARIDEDNKHLIKALIAKHGFPKRSDVGEDAAEAAFLMVQHLHKDTIFQKQVLEQMQKLVPLGEANKSEVALLTDRVMLQRSGTQLYGTQFKTLPAKPGHREETEFYPIVDPGHVNKRRKKMDLPPLEKM